MSMTPETRAKREQYLQRLKGPIRGIEKMTDAELIGLMAGYAKSVGRERAQAVYGMWASMNPDSPRDTFEGTVTSRAAPKDGLYNATPHSYEEYSTTERRLERIETMLRQLLSQSAPPTPPDPLPPPKPRNMQQ